MKNEYIRNSFKKINIELSDYQINQFIKYYELLVDYNKNVNLTAIIDFEEVILKHFIDSVFSSSIFKFNSQNIIDIGTGAGFPGIPLKIVFPDINITLLDSLNKRCDFLKMICNELNFKEGSYKVLHGRAEEYGKNIEYREQFDICVSRAVSNLNTLSEYCLPFIRVGGYFISYKGDKGFDEYEAAKNAISILGCDLLDIRECFLPDSDIKRVFVVIKKVSNTDIKYPRKAGTPDKKPLK